MSPQVINIVLLAALFGLELLHYKERRELTNRIMAKDTKEYIQITESEKGTVPKQKINDPARKDFDRLRQGGFVE